MKIINNSLSFRYIFGPTPLYICYFNLFLKRTVTTQILIFLDAIMISRFIFIFVLINPSAFQDDFWSLFGNIWVVTFSWIGQIASEVMLGCENINVNICAGKNITISEDCQLATRNDRFNGIIGCLTVIIHIFVIAKIQIFKWNENGQQRSQQSKISWRNFLDINYSSLIYYTSMCFMYLFTASSHIIIKKLTLENDRGNLYDIFNRLLRIPFTTILLQAHYFWFHKQMLKKIVGRFSDWLKDISRWDDF